MKTKRIWMWSFIFGLITSVVAYMVLFSDQPFLPSSASKVDVEPSKVVEAAEADEEEKDEETKKENIERVMNNPIIEVSEGKRAISLSVALDQGVSGYVEPNSHVDIIAYESYVDEKTEKEYRSAVLVLQNVKVLASGKSSDGTDEALRYETVTVEVTAEEGVMLGLASLDKDGFYLMLRNNEDESVEKEIIKQTREVIKDKEGEDEE